MKLNRSIACALAGAAMFAAPAQAASGELDPSHLTPFSCDVSLWWNTSTNPMAGATVPNPTYCVRSASAWLKPILSSDAELPEIHITA